MVMGVKHSVFISSSSEGLEVAKAVKSQLEDPDLDVTIWNEREGGQKVFQLNQSALDSLLRAASMYDFAVLILTLDDLQKSRQKNYKVPRDNVIFELGLFFGRLGPRHAFILCEEGAKVLSDFKGITISKFTKPLIEKDLNIAITSACNEIRDAIKEHREYSELGVLPSTALAIGYYENFISKIHEALLSYDYVIKDGGIVKIDGTQMDQRPDSFVFTIVIPDSINFFEEGSLTDTVKTKKLNEIQVHTGTRDFSFYVKGEINTKEKVLRLYDFPTTLLSSRKSVELLLSEPFIGLSKDQEKLESREIQNFRMTLENLIKKNLQSSYNEKRIQFEEPSCLNCEP
jgi:hypothetical protein